MRVLVTDASRNGVTDAVAERIAARLRTSGLTAAHVPIAAVGDVESYDAVIVGGGISWSHWTRPARTFVRRHEEELARRPVWLFSSGGQGNLDRPREFDEFRGLVEPEDEVVFAGLSDPSRIDAWAVGIAERLEQLRRDRAIDTVHQMSDTGSTRS